MIRLALLVLLLAQQCVAANWTPLAFGAVGDCSTDDSTAFINMRTAIIAQQGVGAETQSVYLQGRCYVYGASSNFANRWTWGIRNLQIFGGGARLRNVTSFASCGAACSYSLVLNRSSFETENWNQTFAQITSAQTFFINTVSAGSSSVTLQNPAGASSFPVGAWVVVFSYDQLINVAGYPPDPRYVDYAQVTSVVGAVVNLSAPLAHDHSATFPENPTAYIGRARIFPLDSVSPVPWGIHAYVQDVTVMDNPNNLRPGDNGYTDPLYKSHQFFLPGGYTLVDLLNVNATSLVPSTISTMNVVGGHMFSTTPDKLINTLNYNNVLIDNSMSECTGVDTINVNSGSIGGVQGTIAGTVTISNASPTVVSWPGQLQVVNNPVTFSTTGTLPSPLLPATPYFVIAPGLTTGSFEISAVVNGAAVNTTTTGSGTHTITSTPRSQAVNCAPRSIAFNGTTLTTPSNLSTPQTWNLNAGGFPVLGSATNATFLGGGGTNVPVGGSPVLTLVVDGINVSVSGNVVTIADVTATAGTFLRCTAPGGPIGRVPSGGGAESLGTTTSITGTYAGPNTAIIATSGLPTIGIGDTMQCHATPVGGIALSGNTYLNYGGPPAPP